jgi:ubiquinone/menaquinone biosynthesis C-methylase UbiE
MSGNTDMHATKAISDHRLPFDIEGEEFKAAFKEYLLSHYFAGLEEEYVNSDSFQNDVNEHVFKRTRRFHDHLVPWLAKVYPLRDAVAIEVGGGTGSSALAFSPYVKSIHCYEIDGKSIDAAEFRLKHFGVTNVYNERELFDPECRFVKSGNKADVILLVAVLEHMTFDEFETVLKTSYDALKPGGVILIAETPNRLTVMDFHSSWMPFYQWLPPKIRKRYASRSPRAHFAYDVNAVSRNNPSGVEEMLTRWGNGVSYHDFEIVFGDNIHDLIVADGWEDEIRPLAPVFPDDEILLDIFQKFNIKANKAFARSWLYMILRKT